MKNYDQNKVERNFSKIHVANKVIGSFEQFTKEEVEAGELSQDQIDFWHREIKNIRDKVLLLLELK